MRIALLTDGMHPYVIGGMQMHSFYLAKFFARNKVHVDLYHPYIENDNGNFLNCFEEKEVAFINPVFVEFPRSFYFPGHYIYDSYRYSKNISLRYMSLEKPDFIYAQGFSGWKLIEERKSGNPSVAPIGVNFHGLNMFQPAFGLRNLFNNYLFRPAVKKNIQLADCVFSLGKDLSALLIERNICSKRIIEIPVGIDTKWLVNEHEVRNNEGISFLFIGRNDKVKGVDLLNEALKNLNAKGAAFTFNFIGPFPANKQLSFPNVNYWGEIRNLAKLREMIKNNDVIVSSSFSEGMPTVIMEAMACGLAAIATKVGAVSELVDSQNGIVIDPGNAASIEESMMTFIKMDKSALLEMKKQSLARVSGRFLWDKIILRILNEIKTLTD